MSKAKPWAKWPIPDEIHPVGTRCFVIRVPDQVQHVGAFRGAMLNLASAYKWADDPEHNAKEVAAVWRDVIENMEECQVFDVRQSPTDPCILQKYDSALGEWVNFANMADCVQQQLPPDNPPGRSQPGENDNGPTPDTGHCYDYDLTLPARGRVLIPVAIHPGYTIAMSNPRGVTSDTDEPLAIWRCWDGGRFILGACTGLYLTVGTDPMPTEHHMRMIMQVPDGSWTVLDPANPYLVPPGMPDGDYVIQVNDAPIANNDGDITFHLRVCSNAAVVTMHAGSSDKSTVGIGDVFTIESVPWGGACGTDEYMDLELSSAAILQVVTDDHVNSCAFSSTGRDYGVWSAYPSGLWYLGNGPLSGTLSALTNRIATWSAVHHTITFKVISF